MPARTIGGLVSPRPPAAVAVCRPVVQPEIGLGFDDHTGNSFAAAAGQNDQFAEQIAGDPDGIFSVVQLINSDEINGDTQASFADVLDSEDPYGEFPAAINDSPLVNLLPTYRFVRRTMKATDFLMWQPPPPSIPVPLGYLQWEFSGSATCSRFCGEARNWKANTEFISGDGMPGLLKSFTKSAPSQMSIDNITLEFGIPTWEGSTDE